jgi:O-succinylbenzoic acid--CoA ligase
MSGFSAAVAGGGPVFLADPTWGAAERQQLHALVETADRAPSSAAARGWLMIASGGTSGKLKFARHDEETIAAAVRGFGGHFGLERVNAVGVLPLYHVSGFMAWMRCALTGGEYWPWDWKRLEAGERPVLSSGNWVLSLVPTQLQRLLQGSVGTPLRGVRGRLGEASLPGVLEWLRQFAIIFIGGGPIWPELADAAAEAKLPISLSYGMTETAAMVAALRPREFLEGARSSGPALPHARLAITDDGLVRIGGESLFRGYWPEWRDAREFVTEDLGVLDERGHLRVLGRRDAMIITGGKKVQPAEVEAALRASGEFADVAVIGVRDAEWGEAVVACYKDTGAKPDFARAVASLAPHQRPKRFVAIAEADWPRNPQGKLNRAVLREKVGPLLRGGLSFDKRIPS